MDRFYKVSKVAKMLNVSTVAVRKWIRSGKLSARRIGKLWMIPESELKRFLGEKPSEVRAVIYARVSSYKQKKDGNLDRGWVFIGVHVGLYEPLSLIPPICLPGPALREPVSLGRTLGLPQSPTLPLATAH